jgi:hypothetical protein
MHTHCHQGSWQFPGLGRRSKFKFRIEAGWGPRTTAIQLPDREWQGELCVPGGRMLGFEPCWISPGQGQPVLRRTSAVFSMRSSAKCVAEPRQNAGVFEFEADMAGEMRLKLNGLEESGKVAQFAAGSRIMWFKDECVRMLRECCGFEPKSLEREDVYYAHAFKAKLHRLVPEAAYTAEVELEDDVPFDREIHYRVRVEQRNAQRAWSSPIWVDMRE